MVLGLAYRTGVPWNETSYSNPEFDELLDQADSTLDMDKRREMMGQLEEIMHEDGPIAQPLWRNIFTFCDTNPCWATRCTPRNYFFGNRLALQQTA